MTGSMGRAIQVLREVDNGYRESAVMMAEIDSDLETISARFQSLTLRVSEVVLLLATAGEQPSRAMRQVSVTAQEEMSQFYSMLFAVANQCQMTHRRLMEAQKQAHELTATLEDGGRM